MSPSPLRPMATRSVPPGPPSPPRSSSWNIRAVVLFVIILGILLAIGLVNWLYRPPVPAGVPEDPEVAAALQALGILDVRTGDLRFVTSLGEAQDSGMPIDSARPARLAKAAAAHELGRAHHRFDPRFDCLLGHVDLASDRLERAERHYRAALSLSRGYGEARLGLGVTLARRAVADGTAPAARSLRLEAIGQLAAVEDRDPFYLPASFDRVLLLIDVGRMEEARRLSNRYAELEPGSVWTGELRRHLDRR